MPGSAETLKLAVSHEKANGIDHRVGARWPFHFSHAEHSQLFDHRASTTASQPWLIASFSAAAASRIAEMTEQVLIRWISKRAWHYDQGANGSAKL